MDRRELLRVLGGTMVVPLSDDLLALGRALRAGAAGRAPARVLDPHQSATVAALTELILPPTDTPGARAAGVPQFIELVLAEWYDDDDRDRFLAGLADLDAQARGLHGADFLGCGEAAQVQLLTALDHALAEERQAAQADPTAPPGRWQGRVAAPEKNFFYMMKRLTLVGYYTSEVGANRELHYQIIPGRYDGCVPLERGGP